MIDRVLRYRLVLLTIAVAAVTDTAGGLVYSAVERVDTWQGLYWAVTTATTIGYGDVTPKTGAGQVTAVIVMLTVVPLYAATISLFTSSVVAREVHDAKREIKRHISRQLGEGKDDIWPS